MKQKLLVIGLIAILSSGCGFHGELTKTESGFKWKSNRPCIIKEDKIAVDGKAEPLINIKMPDIVGGKVGD